MFKLCMHGSHDLGISFRLVKWGIIDHWLQQSGAESDRVKNTVIAGTRVLPLPILPRSVCHSASPKVTGSLPVHGIPCKHSGILKGSNRFNVSKILLINCMFILLLKKYCNLYSI